MENDSIQRNDSIWPAFLADQHVQLALAVAEEIAAWNIASFGEMRLQASEVERMAGIAFFVTHEHHSSAIRLTRLNHTASAMALMRPAFESYVHGIWLMHADEEQLSKFQKGYQSSGPEKLIRMCVKATNKERYAGLLETWEQSKPSLHGFVHNSYQSLIRRSGAIDFTKSEIVDLLRFSGGMALHASLELLEMMKAHAPPDEDATIRSSHLVRLQNELLRLLERVDLVERLSAAVKQ